MTITKNEALEMVVAFWASKLEGRKNLNNGDPKAHFLAAMLDSSTPKATTKQVEQFKTELKSLIEDSVENGRLDIYCDYDPAKELVTAAKNSGIKIEMTTFGFKTGTSIRNNILCMEGKEYTIA